MRLQADSYAGPVISCARGSEACSLGVSAHAGERGSLAGSTTGITPTFGKSNCFRQDGRGPAEPTRFG